MSAMTSQITGVSIVCSTLGSNTDQRKHLSSASLAFVRGIHRWPVNSLHKWPVTRRRFPLDDVIMVNSRQAVISTNADPIHWHKCTALGGDKFIVCDSPPISTVLAQMLHAYHYDDVKMTMLASQITSLTVVYSIVYSGVNQRKHQSSASLAFVREIHRGPVNFPHKWPVTRKMFPFDDVIMIDM